VNGRDAVRSYLLSCRKHGDAIPKPSSPARSSGQFRVRMPKSLHARLVAQAEREGVSLNVLMVAAAAQTLGQRETSALKKSLAAAALRSSKLPEMTVPQLWTGSGRIVTHSERVNLDEMSQYRRSD